jgi:hypothetical protein
LIIGQYEVPVTDISLNAQRVMVDIIGDEQKLGCHASLGRVASAATWNVDSSAQYTELSPQTMA